MIVVALRFLLLCKLLRSIAVLHNDCKCTQQSSHFLRCCPCYATLQSTRRHACLYTASYIAT